MLLSPLPLRLMRLMMNPWLVLVAEPELPLELVLHLQFLRGNLVTSCMLNGELENRGDGLGICLCRSLGARMWKLR